jgi:phosphoserine aminotransferase
VVELDTADPEVRVRFEQEVNDRTRRLVRGFRAEAIDTLELDTASPFLPALQHFFKNRERRH